MNAKQEIEMVDFNKNNVIVQPMIADADSPYAKNQTTPYETQMDDVPPQIDQQFKIQPQPTIVEDVGKSYSCWGEDSLQARAQLNFVRKVYLILASQLLITIGVCSLSYFVPAFLQFQIDYYWVSFIFVGLMLIMMLFSSYSQACRFHPYNLISLLVFTLCFSYILSFTTSLYAYYYGGSLVLEAAVLTLAVVIGLTIFALFSRNQYNLLFALIFVLVISFGGFGILCIFEWNPVTYTLYCAIGVAVGGIFLIIDTKMIIGGQRSFRIPLDDYVFGALILYMDIIRIFLYILRMLAAAKRR